MPFDNSCRPSHAADANDIIPHELHSKSFLLRSRLFTHGKRPWCGFTRWVVCAQNGCISSRRDLHLSEHVNSRIHQLDPFLIQYSEGNPLIRLDCSFRSNFVKSGAQQRPARILRMGANALDVLLKLENSKDARPMCSLLLRLGFPVKLFLEALDSS